MTSSALTSAAALPQTAMMSAAQTAPAEAGGSAARGGDHAHVAQVAQQFEQMYLSQMLGHMFDTVGSDTLFGGGHGEEMFRSLMTDAYSKQVVKHGGVGIANAVMHTLLAEQEKTQ